jgi:hypothetical protein
MADVIPLDPEAAVCRRSEPGSRMSRIVAYAQPQLMQVANEYAEAAFPPEFADRARKLARDLVALSMDARAYEEGTPKRASYFMNRVLAGVRVDE